ncbi:hypothetical protein [uncultured Aquimarina sp.]|uniref:hypothetical protein n=1 Tax=uncultured Aquimarina sp. TaxID=575652 RepID=UPI0026317F22|nr:hypothetical protein [uncultured Aquimarina sp.]
MKIKHFTQILIALGFLLSTSCQQEETVSENENQSFTEDLFAKNWQEADLSSIFTGKEMNYPISITQLENVLDHKDVYQIRFVPGVIDDELLVKIISIDASGNVLAEELVGQNKDLQINNQLNGISTIGFNRELISDPTVAKHILRFDEAVEYMNSWGQKSNQDINEVTSFGGMRVRHFSIEPNVVSHMIDQRAEFINLSWGLNKNNKLTTVFLPVTNSKIQLTTKNGNGGSAYDFTTPCPPDCDPN